MLSEFLWRPKPAQQSEAHMGMLELLKSRALLMPLGIAIVMQLSQQLSGKWLAICVGQISLCFVMSSHYYIATL